MDTQEITLLNGIFSPGEATHLLLSFLESKIRFHQMEIFSAQELSSGADTSRNEVRLRELLSAKEKVKQIIQVAEEQGKHLSLHSQIEVTLVNG